MIQITVNPFSVTKIGKPEQWLIEAGAVIGLEFSGFVHEITTYFVNHGIKRHGNAEAEKVRGQVAVTSADIDRIPDIVKSPDCAIIGIKRHEETLIAYSRQFDDGTAIYYEEVLNSRKNKSLRSKTLYKKMGTVSSETFLKIVAILKYDNICHFVCKKYVKTSPYCGISWQIFTVTSIIMPIRTYQA